MPDSELQESLQDATCCIQRSMGIDATACIIHPIPGECIAGDLIDGRVEWHGIWAVGGIVGLGVAGKWGLVLGVRIHRNYKWNNYDGDYLNEASFQETDTR